MITWTKVVNRNSHFLESHVKKCLSIQQKFQSQVGICPRQSLTCVHKKNSVNISGPSCFTLRSSKGSLWIVKIGISILFFFEKYFWWIYNSGLTIFFSVSTDFWSFLSVQLSPLHSFVLQTPVALAYPNFQVCLLEEAAPPWASLIGLFQAKSWDNRTAHLVSFPCLMINILNFLIPNVLRDFDS